MDRIHDQETDFLSERVLKDLFLSEWYVRSMHGLALPESARRVLDRIGEDSERERERALDVFKEWIEREGGQESERRAMFEAEMLHVARMGFLKALIEAKDASAQFFQKAALLAPRDLSDKFAQLGAVDVDHAMRLRRLLVDTFYHESPYPYEERHGLPRS